MEQRNLPAKIPISANETTSPTPTNTTPSRTSLDDAVYSELLDRIRDEKPESSKRTAARSAYALRIIARFELASGVKIKPERKAALISELQVARVPYAQMQIAEQFILQVRTKYGTLTLGDFFPTQKELDAAGLDSAGAFRAAYDQGYRDGFGAGRLIREFQQEKK